MNTYRNIHTQHPFIHLTIHPSITSSYLSDLNVSDQTNLIVRYFSIAGWMDGGAYAAFFGFSFRKVGGRGFFEGIMNTVRMVHGSQDIFCPCIP